MGIVERITKVSSVTISRLEKELNFGNGTIKRWDVNSPSIDKIVVVANYLNVSIDYLCTGKEYKPAAVLNQGIFGNKNENNNININGGDNKLSDIENEILRVCGNLDMRAKNKLLTYAYDLESKNNI